MGIRDFNRNSTTMTVTDAPGLSGALFAGCCVPPAVALTAWCCPCVALGNLAALRGESCVKWAIFFLLPPLNCICHYKLRQHRWLLQRCYDRQLLPMRCHCPGDKISPTR